MAVTIRKVKWISSSFRPTPMPSTKCPRVKDWSTGEIGTAIMGVNHCMACAAAVEIHLFHESGTGEIHCAAG